MLPDDPVKLIRVSGFQFSFWDSMEQFLRADGLHPDLSILFLRFWQHMMAATWGFTSTFNSLFEIPPGCVDVWVWEGLSFQFSFWDSPHISWLWSYLLCRTFNSLFEILNTYTWYHVVATYDFQFSFWDSRVDYPRFWLDKYFTFNSLFEILGRRCRITARDWYTLSILFLRFAGLASGGGGPRIRAFQFSFWDSVIKLKALTFQYYMKLSILFLRF